MTKKMWANILFLLTCTVFKEGFTKNRSSILSRLPEMLQYLCPGADVCRGNHTIQTPKRVFRPGFGSCCTACSCSPDCEENGFCCLPSKQPYATEHDDYDDASQKGRGCFYPTTLGLQEHTSFYKSYYMVTDVSNDRKFNSSISCGDAPVAYWGSLFPVFSAKRKKIYKNSACANADDVSDGKAWDALLLCDVDFYKFMNYSRHLDAMDFAHLTLMSDFMNCYINFIYRGNMEDIQPLRCYKDVIDVCPHFESIQISDEIGFSKDEIIEACQSGLFSPYRPKWLLRKMYANVFCYICNEIYFFREGVCEVERSNITTVGPMKATFSGLIDAEFFFTEGNTKSLETKRKLPTACNPQNRRSCRPVFCPSGQSYDRSGKCKYTIKRWYDTTFEVHLNFTVVGDLNSIKLLQSNDVINVLNLPWPKNWHVATVKYDTTNSNQKIAYVYVVYNSRIRNIHPTYQIADIKELATREWIVEVNKTKCVLNSDLMSLVPRASYDSIRLGNSLENISVPSYLSLYTHMSLALFIGINPPILITRLYFCNQVELTRSEFILSENKMVLFNVITQSFIFNGEFMLIESNEVEDLRARICFETSGFAAANKSAVSNTNAILGMFWFWIILSVCLVER